MTMPSRRRCGALLALAFALPAFAADAPASSAAAAAPSAALPVATIKPVTDTYWGVAITDPYRYFENIQDPEVAAWMKAHSDHARQVLDALPDHAHFARRLAELEGAAGERVMRAQRAGDGRLYYLQRGAGNNQFRLMARDATGGAPAVLVDPDALQKATGQPHAINFFRPSPSGRYLGYGVSVGGSEAATLHVLDVRTGKEVIDPIPRANFGIPQWSDDQHFTMEQLLDLPAGAPAADRYKNPKVLAVDLQKRSITELPTRQWTDLHLTPDMEVTVRRLPDGQHALLTVVDGVRNELAHYVGRWRDITQPTAHWTQVVSFDDGAVRYAVHGMTLYLATHDHAPRLRIVARDLAHPMHAAREVVPASNRVIVDVRAARDALYYTAREGNAKHLWRVAYQAGATPKELPLPVQGQLYLDAGYGVDVPSATQPGVIVAAESWTQASRYVAVGEDGHATPLGLPAPRPMDEAQGIVATEVMVPTHDGVQVPMSILHRADVKLDGSNPTWLTAYASYGMTIEPNYNVQRQAWLERGGVLAFANPRGSGVFGHDWYVSGKGPHKPNTWNDLIACAEYLVQEHWTTPAHLGLSGGSAGGMLVGRVLTERPDLFAAIVPRVGLHDTLRFETTGNGPGNTPEFGSVATREGFEALRAMSPYDHVKPGTAYPAVLFTHGVNDPRVDVWASTKMAARVMAATTTTQPVLLRLQYDAGHGVGNTKQQQLAEEADIEAFLWHQLGGAAQ